MKTLHIDIETYSSVDLKKSGVYRYVEAPDFEILLFGYSVDGGEVKVVEPNFLPSSVITALFDERVEKWAFNAAFERVCISAWLKRRRSVLAAHVEDADAFQYLTPESWRCTSVMSAYAGVPLSLEGVQKVLGLSETKMAEGKNLIGYFSKPCKPTKTNGGQTRNTPGHNPEKWETFRQYCAQDVAAEMELHEYLTENAPVPLKDEWEMYELDQRINDRGVRVDLAFADAAIKINDFAQSQALNRITELTKGEVENPQSVTQLKNWLERMGYPCKTLNAESVAAELSLLQDGAVKDVLRLRQELAKSSVKKYQAIKQCACADGRARGLFKFYGARTGRWAGRLIQVQNLPRASVHDIDYARELAASGDGDAVDLLYGSVSNTLSALVRTAFIPDDESAFAVVDFSAIEARVISWLAGEDWRNEVFATHGKIYEASAAQMFRVPIESVTKDSPLRQKGKIAELALGYGGGVGALQAMGALKMGLTEEELQPLVTAWRQANPAITRLWASVDGHIKTVVRMRLPEKKALHLKGLSFYYKPSFDALVIRLPGGRELVYRAARITPGKFGETVTYMGASLGNKWGAIESYGPKFVENIVQAISRDLLAFVMRELALYNTYVRLDRIVMHVHDEVVIESVGGKTTAANSDLEVICNLIETKDAEALRKNYKGLNLKADGFVCKTYRKS